MYGPADATASKKTPSTFASFKPRLVLPFWYQPTQVVLPLNKCSSSGDAAKLQNVTCILPEQFNSQFVKNSETFTLSACR